MKGFSHKRRCLRHSVDGLLGSFMVEIQADLLNISLFGVSVRTPVALEVGQPVTCDLGEEADAVSVRGAIAWQRSATAARDAESAPAGYFDVGVRFDEDLLPKAEALLRFLDSLTIVKLTKGVFGRFELDYEVPIRLLPRCEFRVKELSSLGLMVETETLLALESHIDLELPLNDKRFLSRARVVWVKKAGGDGEIWRLGMEFFQPTQKHLERLQRYIEQAIQQ